MDIKELQTLSQQRLTDVWDFSIKAWPKLSAFSMPKLTINNRMKVNAAWCRTEGNHIELASCYLLTYPGYMIKQIIPHELAHQIDYNLNGWFKGKHHHNAYWCGYMGRFGLPPDAYITVEPLNQRKK